MTRVTSTILIFLIILNGTVTVMQGSGLSEDIGVTLAPGVDKAINKAVGQAKDGFSASEGLGDTLFSLFVAAMSTVSALFNSVFAAPTMFTNLGFPSWFVWPVFTPMYLISTLELIYVATGRGMI